jgi:hypothetical protein
VQSFEISRRVDVEPIVEDVKRKPGRPQLSDRFEARGWCAPSDSGKEAWRAATQTEQVEPAILGWTNDCVNALECFSGLLKQCYRKAGAVGADRDGNGSMLKSAAEDALETGAKVFFSLLPDLGGCGEKLKVPFYLFG